MFHHPRLRTTLFAAIATFGLLTARGADTPSAGAPGAPVKTLIDVATPGSEALFKPDDQANGQVTVSRSSDPSGIVLTIAPGTSKFPGVMVKAVDGQPWNCSAFGHIEARVTNLGTTRSAFVMGVADTLDGQSSNSDVVRLNPGQSGLLKVTFGYSYGQPATPINSANVDHLLIFASQAKTAPEVMRIESLQAAGTPGEKLPVNPANVIIKPINGILFGPGIKPEARQIIGTGGASARLADDGATLMLAFSGANQSATLRPAEGVWSLNDYLKVTVKLKNSGQTPVTPSLRLDSRRGNSDAIAAAVPLAPGAETEITVPFQAAVPWKGISVDAQNVLPGKKEWGGEPGTGTPYYSNLTTGITVLASGAGELQVESIVAGMTHDELPAWLGQRPPIDGAWTKTFEDNFDGNTIDLKKWNIYMGGTYHLGKYNHFSKDNVIVKDGKVILRIDKKRGHHDDDPNAEVNDLATGNLDTFGKFTQRYGYFEVKLKLSTIPGMFPAFWLMPDRGIGWKGPVMRNSTRDGGMEFDIMETQSVWGPWRHDFGMHWDGYFQYHKSNGAFTQYVQPDRDGFITVGMLWTPGKVVEYDDGRMTGSWESPRVGDQQEYMIIDNVTGGWENQPLDETQLPGDLTIDYVRVWQRQDLASPQDGPKPNNGGPYAPGQGPMPAPAAAP